MLDEVWHQLGLSDEPRDAAEVRRAYAKRLREIDRDHDVASFQQLRAAYEQALAAVGEGRRRPGGLHTRFILRPKKRPPSDSAKVEAETDAATEAALRDGNQEAARQRREAANLLIRVQKRLGQDPPDYEDLNFWKSVLSQSYLTDMTAVHRLEANIVSALLRQCQSNLASKKTMKPPDAWLAMMEHRFGWRSDGIAFRRRHPGAAYLQEFLYPTERSRWTRWFARTRRKPQAPLFLLRADTSVLAVLGLILASQSIDSSLKIHWSSAVFAVFFLMLLLLLYLKYRPHRGLYKGLTLWQKFARTDDDNRIGALASYGYCILHFLFWR